MAGNHYKPITAEDLPEVAAFLNMQQEVTARDDPTQARPRGDSLRWLLDNPHLGQGRALGETIRTSDGKILGMILAAPALSAGRQAAPRPGGGQLLCRCVGTNAGFFPAPALSGDTGCRLLVREFLQPPVRRSLGQVRRRHGPGIGR